MKHEGYNPLSGNTAYKYQFGGKELQKETGWNDFGARMYMSDIGRWGVVDPMAEAEASWTPYRYGFNNPIMFSDPTGMIEQNDINNMLSTGGSYNYSNGNLNYLGGGSLGGNYLTDDRFREGYYTPAADFLDYIDIPELVMSAPKSYKGNSALIGLTLGMAIPRHLAAYLGYKQEPYVYRGPEPGGGSVKMMGGFLDFLGLYDIAGTYIENNLSKNDQETFFAATLVAAVVLKKPGLLLAEERAILNTEKGIIISKGATKKGVLKADYLFENMNDAKNFGSKALGSSKTRIYDGSGKWIGWENKTGDQVYWGHGDWGKSIGSSTFPHLNYNINGQKGHLFLNNKINNRGQIADFKAYFNLGK